MNVYQPTTVLQTPHVEILMVHTHVIVTLDTCCLMTSGHVQVHYFVSQEFLLSYWRLKCTNAVGENRFSPESYVSRLILIIQ